MIYSLSEINLKQVLFEKAIYKPTVIVLVEYSELLLSSKINFFWTKCTQGWFSARVWYIELSPFSSSNSDFILYSSGFFTSGSCSSLPFPPFLLSFFLVSLAGSFTFSFLFFSSTCWASFGNIVKFSILLHINLPTKVNFKDWSPETCGTLEITKLLFLSFGFLSPSWTDTFPEFLLVSSSLLPVAAGLVPIWPAPPIWLWIPISAKLKILTPPAWSVTDKKYPSFDNFNPLIMFIKFIFSGGSGGEVDSGVIVFSMHSVFIPVNEWLYERIYILVSPLHEAAILVW